MAEQKPDLPGAQSGHYELLRSVGIHRFDQLGWAEPKKLYERLVIETKQATFDVKLPDVTVIADWVQKSWDFANRFLPLKPEVMAEILGLPGERQDNKPGETPIQTPAGDKKPKPHR